MPSGTSLADFSFDRPTSLPLPAFLNIHWFCDKVGLTGSIYQMINAVFLLGAYVSVRLLFGVYNVSRRSPTVAVRWRKSGRSRLVYTTRPC